MSEWKELKTLQDLAAAQAAGEEIEVRLARSVWERWAGVVWNSAMNYRSRPAKPKTKKVKLQAWFNGTDLFWKAELVGLIPSNWVRVPAEDKEIEVPE